VPAKRASRRRAFTLTLAAFAAASQSACNQKKKRVIAVVPKATSHVFWVAVRSGAIAAGKELDVEVLWNGPAAETEFARQIQIVDSMAARRVDGIALAASERKALVAPVERALQAGIPVTVFDSGLDSEAYTSFVATNNFEGGQIAARELAALAQKGELGMVMHAPGSFSTMERERGFEETIAKEFPALKITARQYGMSDRAKARTAAENMLNANPNLAGIFASSEPSAIGAMLAVEARGSQGRVRVVGFDSSDGLADGVRKGVIQALVVQDPFRMGYEAVKTVNDKLNGKPVPKRIDLSAQLVRLADLEKPEIKRLLAPELDAAAKP
jgi:ribose transport system substrate-binding protein